MKNLANDIREYIKASDPFEYRHNYETDAAALAEIMDLLQSDPEVIIDYLQDLQADIRDTIETVNEDTAAHKRLDAEYTHVNNLVTRIRQTFAGIAV